MQLNLSPTLSFLLHAQETQDRDLLAATLRVYQIRSFVSTSSILDSLAGRLPCEGRL